MPRFRKGFMEVAREIIREHPDEGWSSEQVAEEALRRDPTLSNAKDPVFSLATTLAKQVRMGWERDIEAREERPIRYYLREDVNRNDGNKPPHSPPIPILDPKALGPETIVLTAGNARFQGPLTSENLDIAISILERKKNSIGA